MSTGDYVYTFPDFGETTLTNQCPFGHIDWCMDLGSMENLLLYDTVTLVDNAILIGFGQFIFQNYSSFWKGATIQLDVNTTMMGF